MGGTNDAERFILGSLTKGLDLFKPDLSAEVSWSEETVNISTALKEGAGPRYGLAPLPGHSNTITPASGNNNGLQYAEAIPGTTGAFEGRRKVFAVVWLQSLQCYAWVVSATNPTPEHFDVGLGSVTASSRVIPTTGFQRGLGRTGIMSGFSGLIRSYNTELLSLAKSGTPSVSDVATLLATSGVYFLSTAYFRTPTKMIAYQNMLGGVVSAPTGAPASGTYQLGSLQISGLATPLIYLGAPSRALLAKYPPNETRVITVQPVSLTIGGDLAMKYTSSALAQDSNTIQSVPYEQTGTATYLQLPTPTKSGAGTSYSSTGGALIFDPNQQTDAGHDVIMVCADRPFAVIYETGLYQDKGMLPRYVDLTRPGMTFRRLTQKTGLNQKPEGSILATTTSPINLVQTLSGVFDYDQSYRLGVSLYNKRLDYETNVEFMTTTDDTVVVSAGAPLDRFCIMIATGGSAATPKTLFEKYNATGTSFPWDFSTTNPASGFPNGQGLHINDYSYRFYYQPKGYSDWLPLEEYDAAQFWFNSAWPSIADADAGITYCGIPIGLSEVGRATGGSPNGFNDYSPLPAQTYIQTLVFRSRIFWFAPNDFRFSPENAPYAYPLRNVVTAKGGQWRGGIEYTRENQTNSQAALFVFAENQTYLATFTGVRAKQSVRVSANTSADYEIDGSDFEMNPLSNATAFSYRSAVNADGTLYYWGPQGVHEYVGSGMPKKISDVLDDAQGNGLVKWVKPSDYAKVCCVYNPRTKEVLWFYPPATTDAAYPTRVLVFDTRSRQFSTWKLPITVRACQRINIEDAGSADKISGDRVVVHADVSTGTVSRTLFFDDLVLSGDMVPDYQTMISAISTPATGQRRLTLASGSTGVTAGGIAVGDYLAFHNIQGWASALSATDMLAEIIAVDNGAGTIDIELPTDGTLSGTFTATSLTAFPVWHRKLATNGLAGVPWILGTNYWLPNGVANSYVWEYLYLLYKYSPWPQPDDPENPPYKILAKMLLENRTMVCGGYTSDVVPLTGNSDVYCQVHYAVPNEDRSANGQAIKLRFSGIALGDPWVLEYLEAHCMLEQGFTLKEFQI